ncbi:MAG TPA: hypothetical protein VKA48_10935 [Gammaproteobacteria bacterium]|nr:hypothetical protein [Gammaproteobacteria bacterium]
MFYGNRRNERRNRQILADVARGMPPINVARDHGVSKNRVYQVVREEMNRKFPDLLQGRPPNLNDLRRNRVTVLRRLGEPMHLTLANRIRRSLRLRKWRKAH